MNLLSVVLRNCSLGGPGAEQLSVGLRANQSITHLDLLSNHIGDDGLGAVCRALANGSGGGCGLCSLQLGDNKITAAGVRTVQSLIREDEAGVERRRRGSKVSGRRKSSNQIVERRGGEEGAEAEEAGGGEEQEQPVTLQHMRDSRKASKLRSGPLSLTALELRDNNMGPEGTCSCDPSGALS